VEGEDGPVTCVVCEEARLTGSVVRGVQLSTNSWVL